MPNDSACAGAQQALVVATPSQRLIPQQPQALAAGSATPVAAVADNRAARFAFLAAGTLLALVSIAIAALNGWSRGASLGEIDDMREAEQRKADIETALAEVPEQKVELHPSAPIRYRNMVNELWSSIRRSEDALPGREASFRHGRAHEHQGSRGRAVEAAKVREQDQADLRQKAREALRALVDHIAPDGQPTDKRGGGKVAVTVHGQLAALLAVDGRTNSADSVRRVVLVAGVGFEPTTFRL